MACQYFATTAVAAALLALPCRAESPTAGNTIRFPGTGTELKLYGFVQVYGQWHLDQNLYDNGALIGGDTPPLIASDTPGGQFTMSARTSRFGFTTVTPSEQWGDLTTRIELDFAKGRGKNGAPRMRLAYIGVGNWMVGYLWSNWFDYRANGAAVDWKGPIGQACYDTGAFTQVRCTCPLAERASLALSVEQNQQAWGEFKHAANPGGKTVPDARYPSLVAALTWEDHWGHVAVRALEQNYGAYTPPDGGAAGTRISRWAGAVQLSGRLRLGRDSLVGSVYTGLALGPYGAQPQAARFDLPGHSVRFYRNTGWQAGYTRHWNDRVRSNLVASGISYRNDPGVVVPSDIQNAQNYFLNTFIKLGRTLELGLEGVHERLKTFGTDQVVNPDGGKSGRNASNKVQFRLTAHF